MTVARSGINPVVWTERKECELINALKSIKLDERTSAYSIFSKHFTARDAKGEFDRKAARKGRSIRCLHVWKQVEEILGDSHTVKQLREHFFKVLSPATRRGRLSETEKEYFGEAMRRAEERKVSAGTTSLFKIAAEVLRDHEVELDPDSEVAKRYRHPQQIRNFAYGQGRPRQPRAYAAAKKKRRGRKRAVAKSGRPQKRKKKARSGYPRFPTPPVRERGLIHARTTTVAVTVIPLPDPHRTLNGLLLSHFCDPSFPRFDYPFGS